MVQDTHGYASDRYGSSGGPHIRPPSAPPYLNQVSESVESNRILKTNLFLLQSYKDKLDYPPLHSSMSPNAKTDVKSFMDFPITSPSTTDAQQVGAITSGEKDRKMSADSSNQQTSVLDSLLEELQTVSRSASTSTLTMPKADKKSDFYGTNNSNRQQTVGPMKPNLSLNFNDKFQSATVKSTDNQAKNESNWLSSGKDTNGQRISPTGPSKDEFSTPPSSPTKKAMPPVYGRVMDSEKRNDTISSAAWPYSKPVSNGGLMRSQSEATNAFSYGNRNPVEPSSFPSSQHYQRQSLSPTGVGPTGIPQQQRSRSGTPTSITSEPPLSYNKRVPLPPAPPVRTASSSRIYADPSAGSWKPNSSFYARYASSDLQSLKSQLSHDYTKIVAKSDFSLPIVQTNAVDVAEDIRLSDHKLKSGSSSESVNSQKGMVPPAIPPSPAKVAPPPPPRTKDSTATLERQKKFFP